MKLLKKRRIEKSYLIVAGIISLFVVIGYFSYAMFTVNKEQKEAIRIITGTLNATLSSEDKDFKNNKITVKANSTKKFTIVLENQNQRDARFNFCYENNLEEGAEVGYLNTTKDIPPPEEGVVISQGESKQYEIGIKNTTEKDITVTFNSNAGLADKELEFPKNGKALEELEIKYNVLLVGNGGVIPNGKTITNMMPNGGFEQENISNLEAGISIERTDIKSYEGKYSLKGSINQGTGGAILHGFNIQENHYYYVSEYFYLEHVNTPSGWNGEFDMYYYNGTIPEYPEYGNVYLNNLELNKWHHLSFLVKSNVVTRYWFRLGYAFPRSGVIDLLSYFDNVMLIDLTEAFGDEAEKISKEELDTMDYFDGTISSATKEVTYGYDYDLPIPTKSDATFDGWYKKNSEGELVKVNNKVEELTEHILYAKWK